jgi:acetylornithine deacetylase/succinyl-diaminopimelate desuccinylase-like protein
LTPELLATIHGHDERVAIEDFERAVTVMSDVVLRASGDTHTEPDSADEVT